MYNFILQTVVFLSLGVAIYLLARAYPRVGDEEPHANAGGFVDRLVRRLPLEKIDALLHAFFEKLLRKIKVIIMKFDNLVNIHINKLKKSSSGSQTSPNGASPQLPDALQNGKKE